MKPDTHLYKPGRRTGGGFSPRQHQASMWPCSPLPTQIRSPAEPAHVSPVCVSRAVAPAALAASGPKDGGSCHGSGVLLQPVSSGGKGGQSRARAGSMGRRVPTGAGRAGTDAVRGPGRTTVNAMSAPLQVCGGRGTGTGLPPAPQPQPLRTGGAGRARTGLWGQETGRVPTSMRRNRMAAPADTTTACRRRSGCRDLG